MTGCFFLNFLDAFFDTFNYYENFGVFQSLKCFSASESGIRLKLCILKNKDAPLTRVQIDNLYL